jgi:hypothetical protein
VGMDVYGRNPSNRLKGDTDILVGEYFRNNMWWWTPLWEYCLSLYGDKMPPMEHCCDHEDGDPDIYDVFEAEDGFMNCGYGLDRDESEELGTILFLEIQFGNTQKLFDEIKGAFPFSVENVQEFSDFLMNCGGFNIY